MRRTFVLVFVFVLVTAACGGGDDAESAADSTADAVEAAVSSLAEGGDPQEAVDDIAEGLEDLQESSGGGGSATLTVGDMTWTFDSVLCAFGEEETRQEGAEFVLSSIQNGMQMYATIDSFGHSVSLDDIQDFENPSVSLSSSEGEVILDGKNVTADMEFRDDTTDDFETVSGHFEGTCP